MQAATGAFPDVKPSYRPAARELVQVLEKHADEVDPQLVANVYDGYDPECRGWAIRVLAKANDEAAAAVLASLLRRLDELPAATWPVLLPLERRPRHGDVIVPALAEALQRDQFARHAAGALLAYARAEGLHGSAETVAAAAASRAREAIGRASTGADDDSKFAQSEAGLYLDLSARTGSQLAQPVLRDSLGSPNAWVAMWAGLGLERLGAGAGPGLFLRVAASPSCRLALYVSLRELGRLNKFPAEFATQAAFAEAEMVTWLMYPAELGSAPDEIELVKTVELPNNGDPSDLYVFRFRTRPPNWAADKGWMTGVAGPFRRADQPSSRWRMT